MAVVGLIGSGDRWFHTKLCVLSEVKLHTDDQTAGITAIAPSPQMLQVQ